MLTTKSRKTHHLCVACSHSKTGVLDIFFEFCVWFWIPCRGDFCSLYVVLRADESDPFEFKMWSANYGNACKVVKEAEWALW